MISRCISMFGPATVGKLFFIAGIAVLAFGLGSAMIARGAPSGSDHHVCVNRYTGQLRHVSGPQRCSPAETPLSWTSFDGAALDDAYVNEDQPDSITSAMLVDGEVTNNDLAGDSVTTDKILDGSVTVDDLGTNSVGSDEVIDNSLTADDLGTGSVRSDEILDGSVTADDLGTNSVGTGEVIDNSLTSDDLGTGSVASAEILNGSVADVDLSAALRNDIDAQTLEGYEIESREIEVSPGFDVAANVVCPSGKRVTGGGVQASSFAMLLRQSYPGPFSQSWWVAVSNPGPGSVTATLYAICVGS